MIFKSHVRLETLKFKSGDYHSRGGGVLVGFWGEKGKGAVSLPAPTPLLQLGEEGFCLGEVVVEPPHARAERERDGAVGLLAGVVGAVVDHPPLRLILLPPLPILAPGESAADRGDDCTALLGPLEAREVGAEAEALDQLVGVLAEGADTRVRRHRLFNRVQRRNVEGVRLPHDLPLNKT